MVARSRSSGGQRGPSADHHADAAGLGVIRGLQIIQAIRAKKGVGSSSQVRGPRN